MRSRQETRAMHERKAEDKFAAYELADSDDFDRRQKARNVLRYQLRGYCFEHPPTCSRWGRSCLECSHQKCRENELYDGEKWDYDFDPDIDRFASLWENLQDMATVSYRGLLDGTADESAAPQVVDTERSMTSLLSALAERAEKACL
ncbi:MAG: hypothetical protein LBI05_01280 [Planctomycetaceae bacterium]|nr:hypothetical protein [Planctomycetaceae bacterium]